MPFFFPHVLLIQPLINNCGFKQNYLKNVAFQFKLFKGSVTHASENDATTTLPSLPHFKRMSLFCASSRRRQLPLIKVSGLQEGKKGLPPKLGLCLPRTTVLLHTFFCNISCWLALGSSVLSAWIFLTIYLRELLFQCIVKVAQASRNLLLIVKINIL